MKTNFTMPGAGQSIHLPTGNAFIVLASVLAVGTISCIAMIFAAVLLAAYLLNLVISALVEVTSHLASVYSHADSFSKIVVWFLVVLVLVKLSPLLARFVRGSLAIR
jgi:hypothetical protein